MSFFIGGELLIVKFHLNTRRYDEEALLSTELKVSGQVGGVQKRDAWAPCPGIVTVFVWMTFWPRYVGCLLVDRCIRMQAVSILAWRGSSRNGMSHLRPLGQRCLYEKAGALD
jgi:hypothetical protein